MNIYSQRDYPHIKLDSSHYSLANQGCVVTCLAMLSGKNPPEVNELLKKRAGFTGPLVIWSRAASLLGLPYNPTVSKALFYPCICETRLGNGSQHFFIRLANGLIVDPLDGRTKQNPYSIRSFRNIGLLPAPHLPPPPVPVPPSGPARWPRVVSVIEPANVRSQPRLNAPLSGSRTLKAGDTFVGADEVVGDSVRGNNKWVRSSKGNYVHSINLRY